VAVLEMSPVHAASYNLFVDLVRLNLLTADWYDANNKESLLHEGNRARAVATLNNLRLSCNVAGNITLGVSPFMCAFHTIFYTLIMD
jgi:hypothetical protein